METRASKTSIETISLAIKYFAYRLVSEHLTKRYNDRANALLATLQENGQIIADESLFTQYNIEKPEKWTERNTHMLDINAMKPIYFDVLKEAENEGWQIGNPDSNLHLVFESKCREAKRLLCESILSDQGINVDMETMLYKNRVKLLETSENAAKALANEVEAIRENAANLAANIMVFKSSLDLDINRLPIDCLIEELDEFNIDKR